MGWERKRGKIEEFNRLLRGATDTSYTVQLGALEILPSVRYCITLDSDTRLPRDVARKLIGIIAHPLNRPHYDEAVGRVTEGYGILQPRVSVTMASAAGSLFARIYAGHTGVDPYTTAVSDTYQDLFSEGIFTGKALYEVDAFTRALEGRVPENALLSHDLFEGEYARTALVSDLEVVDDYPSSLLAHARRLRRWVRGDWQILLWLFPFVPTRGGAWQRNRLPLISRWKIFDNLRRSLVPPATVALLFAAWSLLPGNANTWTAAVLLAMSFPVYPLVLRTVRGPRQHQPPAVFLRAMWEELKTALAQVALQLTFLAYHAHEMVHDRPHPGAADRHPARPAGVGDGRGGLTRPRRRHPPLPARDGGQPHPGPARPRARPGRPPLGARHRPAGPHAVGGGTPHRLRAQPARPLAAAGARRGGPRAPARDRAEDLGVVREVRGRRGPRAAPGQLPGGPRRPRRPPHVADQHRHGPPGHAGRSRLRVHLYGRAGIAHRPGPGHDGRAGALRGPSPELVRHLDPGSAPPALRLHRRQREPGRGPDGARGGTARDRTGGRFRPCGAHRPRRAPPGALADAMDFRFLYDPQRRIFSIGYRLADAEGPARLDASYYDLLASESRLASFLAIAKGDVPQAHWFHLGRLLTSIQGSPTLLSWSATMFEYLMPLLVMRSYPETLLDLSCQMAVRRQKEYGAERGIPWGISESGYNVVDRADNYQYKAFGVPGLGLKRGLADDLVVAPYATALAAMVDPRGGAELPPPDPGRARGPVRLLRGRGLHASRRPRRTPAPKSRRATVIRSYLAHHQGMTLVALANALLGDPMVALPRRPEGPGHGAAAPGARAPAVADHAAAPVEETRTTASAPPPRHGASARPTPRSRAQFLSSNYTAVVTNGGRGASFCRGRVVTRHRQDLTRDPGSQFIISATCAAAPSGRPPITPWARTREITVTFRRKATFRRLDDGIGAPDRDRRLDRRRRRGCGGCG